MFNPPHPGAVAKRMLIDETGYSIEYVSKLLNCSEYLFKTFLNGTTQLSPALAAKLSILLNTTTEMWINMQALYDLNLANKCKKKLKDQIKSIKTETVS